MTLNPIHKVLSTMRAHNVRCLLMGGQACVFYGAAEFSRDTDLALLAEPDNIERLRRALRDLQAATIAVPRLELKFLQRGHAVHFRCEHPDAMGMRIDVMSVLRGLPPFPVLWDRRAIVQLDAPDERFDLLSLADLVQAKKTQRDKDWPMIRRLIEADVVAAGDTPSAERARFWLREGRTPGLLADVARRHPDIVRLVEGDRPLLRGILSANESDIERLLRIEEDAERAADRAYWAPLRRELEALRHGKSAVGYP